MPISETNSIYCNYCGKKFATLEKRSRFCSLRCEKLFASKFNSSIFDDFNLSNELLKLQLQIQKSVTPTSSLSKEAILDFYDTIFNQISKILKVINSQALENEKNDDSQNYATLKKKLEQLIIKAAELRLENKALKQKFLLLKNKDTLLASTLLGIEKNADLTTSKKAYNSKVKQFHPDVYSENDDVFKAVKLAFEIMRVSKRD